MKKSKVIEKWLFRVSLIMLLSVVLFSSGFVVGWKEIGPYKTILEFYKIARSIVKFGTIVPEGLVVPSPGNPSGKVFSVLRSGKMQEGYYAFLLWDQDNGCYAAWLYDYKGELLHKWLLDYETMDPDGPSAGSDAPHGFAVLTDGSILVNYDKGDVLARVDSCGKPLWVRRDGVFHHSLQRAEDGSYWTWRAKVTAYGHYQYLLNFDPDTGNTIREIGLVEDLIQTKGEESLFFFVRPDFPFQQSEQHGSYSKNIFHPNDIDVLYSDLAPLFPNFAAGDLLISLRKMNLIAVIDPTELSVRWASYGPWKYQHDPDFTRDGKISVFNNNYRLNRSEIIKIDPTTMESTNDLFHGDLHFHSNAMGKHQYLPNGNVLVVVPGEGRVMIASPSGETIMKFNNVWNKNPHYNAHVENGTWLPVDYFDTLLQCTQ
ncbi:MAG: arylsulfotransferase family protein [Planctomycetota bacterium]